MAGARTRVREWMQAAGLETRVDAIGNLAGRRGEPRMSIGSHLDSVADAGRYDGVLGVLIGLAVAGRCPTSRSRSWRSPTRTGCASRASTSAAARSWAS